MTCVSQHPHDLQHFPRLRSAGSGVTQHTEHRDTDIHRNGGRRPGFESQLRYLLSGRLLEALSGRGTVTHQLPDELLCSRGASANLAPTPGQLSPGNFLLVALYAILLPQATEEARETSLYFKGCANMRNSLAPGKCVRLILAAITVTKEALLSLASKAKDDFDLWGWGRAATGKAMKKAKAALNNRHAHSSRARKGHLKMLHFRVWRCIVRLDIALHTGFSSHLTLL
ncbi:uncharacterized protein LOC114211902 [Eumetopias jubatus]|uniref:uncharacterized protein LOC114211902 n=1 Tax=Eumetopias jubatus TaxID=34886 RepID=UPI0010161816|nr:uncharacterized protein LOC114211902 [Eumetopias jubatus]